MKTIWSTIVLSVLASFIAMPAFAWERGIYLTQYTLEKPQTLDHLLQEAKATHINTFIIDHEYIGSKYYPAIAKVKANGIKYIARIIVFPDGGYPQQILSPAYWDTRYKLVNDAIKAGADEIQLDYIRYSSKLPANPQHAHDVLKILKWFKQRINAQNVPMQIDIFGEVSYHPSLHIGQDIDLFAKSVDGVNPMVYPSHFWPYQEYSKEPYKTVNNSLNNLAGKFNNNPPFRIRAFIEAANFHYLHQMGDAARQKYLLAEIRAVENAHAVSGWYVWSAHNDYDNLFAVLKKNQTKISKESVLVKKFNGDSVAYAESSSSFAKGDAVDENSSSKFFHPINFYKFWTK